MKVLLVENFYELKKPLSGGWVNWRKDYARTLKESCIETQMPRWLIRSTSLISAQNNVLVEKAAKNIKKSTCPTGKTGRMRGSQNLLKPSKTRLGFFVAVKSICAIIN